MFFIFFLAFAQLGYLLFGSQVEEYSSFEMSMYVSIPTVSFQSTVDGGVLRVYSGKM